MQFSATALTSFLSTRSEDECRRACHVERLQLSTLSDHESHKGTLGRDPPVMSDGNAERDREDLEQSYGLGREQTE